MLRVCWLLLIIPIILMFSGCNESTPKTNDSRESDPRLTIIKPSPAINASQHVSVTNEFVGSSQCKSCHTKMHDGFIETDHHFSLRPPDVDEERKLDRFSHELSQQVHSVNIENGKLVHRATQTFQGEEFSLPITSAEIKYVMGSGAFAKSYLHQLNGSLFQTPLSYYIGPEKYDMSPGYDSASHVGFTREISDECMFCHAGIAKRTKTNPYQFIIHELAIGCERCHGKGKLHVNRMKDAESDPTHSEFVTDDLAIVNPNKLDRQRLESLCAQCHLQGEKTLYPRGKNAWSFKPGNLIEQTKIEYAFQSHSSEIGFVGHFSQMHASECYQNSDTLSCVSCHDPHHKVDEQAKISSYRENCLRCHDNLDCGVNLDSRVNENENSCFDCHMPRGTTEVPHVAITNHQIGIHNKKTQSQGPEIENALPEAVALIDSTKPGSWQRERNRLTALSRWMIENKKLAQVPVSKIKNLINELRQSLDRHPSLSAEDDLIVVNPAESKLMLAQLISPDAGWRYSLDPEEPITRTQYDEFMSLVSAVVKEGPDDPFVYTLALSMAASELSSQRNHTQARRYYERLVTLRQNSADWYNLGLVYGRLRQFSKAENAFKNSIEIEANYEKPYRSLSRLYENIDPNVSQQMKQIADLLNQNRSNHIEKTLDGQ